MVPNDNPGEVSTEAVAVDSGRENPYHKESRNAEKLAEGMLTQTHHNTLEGTPWAAVKHPNGSSTREVCEMSRGLGHVSGPDIHAEHKTKP